MKYIQRIIEGAELVLNDLGYPVSVNLTWENSKSKLEYLKTKYVEYGVKPIKSNKYPEIGIYYGLEIDEKLKDNLDNTREKVNLKITADFLKKSNIQGGSDSLYSFLNKSVRHISEKYAGIIDFILPMGSTKSLSGDLANSLIKIFPGSKISGLDKHNFENIVDALNWDYIIEYDNNVDRVPILNKIKDLVKAEAKEMSNKLREDIKSAKTGRDLRIILFKSNPKHQHHDIEYQVTWKNTPYIVRSSGVSFGGSRQFFKNKYRVSYIPNRQQNATTDLDLIEAIRQCIFNDKTILIVDDNISTKIDIYSILDTIVEIGDSIIETSSNIVDYKTSLNIKSWKKRINVYALIYFDKVKLATQADINSAYDLNIEKDDASDNI